jgi:hypothetical protein
MPEFSTDIYEHIAGSFGNKRWVSAAVAADYGNSQALAVAPPRRSFTAFALSAGMLTNRSGEEAILGIGVRYRVATWEAGQVSAAGAYTDDTTHAQDATTGNFQLHDRADSGSGFLIGGDERFNTIAVVQAAAGDQTDPVQTLEYWNGASWVDIAASCFLNMALDADGTGEKVLCFPIPFDWVVGGSGTGVPAGRYNLRVLQTTGGAGSADPVASQLFVGFNDFIFEAVPDRGTLSIIRGDMVLFPRSGEALFPLTSVPSQANALSLGYTYWT